MNQTREPLIKQPQSATAIVRPDSNQWPTLLRASFFAVWFVLSAPSAVLAAPDCIHWMDNDHVDDVDGKAIIDFWKTATADDVARCLKAGAYLEARTNKCVTALHVAAWLGNADTVMALLKAGASPKARNRNGKRPIDFADQEGKLTGPAYWQLYEASLN